MPNVLCENTNPVAGSIRILSLPEFQAMTKRGLVYGLHSSPFGQVFAAALNGWLCGLLFQGNIPQDYFLQQVRAHLKTELGPYHPKTTAPFVEQVFSGERPPLILTGTSFQLKVWMHLLEIPKGQVLTYQELAKAVEAPRAMRSIGQALKANPLAYVLPCHRVISASGKLGGYRWGVNIKGRLLREEISGEVPFLASKGGK